MSVSNGLNRFLQVSLNVKMEEFDEFRLKGRRLKDFGVRVRLSSITLKWHNRFSKSAAASL